MLDSSKYTGTQGVYAKAVPAMNSNFKKLCHILENDSLNEIYEDPHVTLVYSKKRLERSLPKDIKLNTVAKCKHVTHWDGHDNAGYVVIELECTAFDKLNILFRNLGAKHSFDEYKAHMTIMKDCGPLTKKLQNYIDKVNSVLSSKWYVLNFKDIYVEDLKS